MIILDLPSPPLRKIKMTKLLSLENRDDPQGRRNEQVARSGAECHKPPSQPIRGVKDSRGR